MQCIAGSLRRLYGLPEGTGTKLYVLIAKLDITLWHPDAKLCTLITTLEIAVWHHPGKDI